MDPPPAPPVSAPSPRSAAPTGYPDSVESSPRSRTTTDTWDDAVPAGGGGGGKLRLMCSYGGHIVPRPHDKSLCYVGGHTRIVVVDRHSSLADLTTRLSKTLLGGDGGGGGGGFSLKYQLPSEELDSLISLSTDEDLENMIDEYDRTFSSSSSSSLSIKPSRLRLFLFPSKPDSASTVGSLLRNSTKSEDWFLNALNGAQSGNSLLGLDEDGVGLSRVSDAQVKMGKQGQDVHSMPDSPMLENSSSFGSTSSSPSMVNLPPIRVHVVEDGGLRLGDHKVVGIEEQFSQMTVAPVAPALKLDEAFVVPTSTVAAAAVPPTSGEYANRVFSDDERSEQGIPVGFRKPPQPPPQQQLPQKPNGGGGGLDLPSPDSVSSDNSLPNATSRPKSAIYQDPVTGQLHSVPNMVSANPVDPKINIYDPNPRAPLLQQVQDPPPPGYVLAPQFDQQQQQQHHHHHQQQQQQQHHQQQPQQQFLHPGTHYIHQPPTGPVPVSSYYPVYPSHHHRPQSNQPYPFYFVPAGSAQAYSLSMPPSNSSEAAPSTIPSSVPQAPPDAYNQTRSGVGAPTLVQVPPGQHQQQQYVGFPQIHHASQSVAPTSTAATANYAYEFADPAHAQIYYSHAMAPQYQTMTTAAPTGVLSESETASHLQGENVKQQMRNLQP